ncbi:hypothetical protein CEXT_585011 [Caerostris extrusa]|uniref:Uncharacterized protein n=1 Tax=Caerostris extrusa TaxID=172846 RepID=A0AAV4P9I1_CAEEX|nr:hypothetical protein CEXT_585011 [Caerostris extrusa]
MNINIDPSLFHMASCKIAISLVSYTEVKEMMRNVPPNDFEISYEQWVEFINTTINKITFFTQSVPTLLRDKAIKGIIKPIAFEIVKWINYHNEFKAIDVDLQTCLQWKTVGKINRLETARKLVQSENLDITTRFLLACKYCLTESLENTEGYSGPFLETLWARMSNAEKDLCTKNAREAYNSENYLISWWINRLKGSEDRSFPENSFFTDYNNADALYYFWSRMTDRSKRKDCLERVLDRCLFRNENLHFWLSKMDSEDCRRRFYVTRTRMVLLYFLEWPFQHVFMNVAKILFDYLPNVDFFSILCFIHLKVHTEVQDFEYQTLLLDFWNAATDTNKQYVRSRSCFSQVMVLMGIE